MPTVAATKPKQDRERARPADDPAPRTVQRSAESVEPHIKDALALRAVFFTGFSIYFLWNGQIEIGLLLAFIVYVFVRFALRSSAEAVQPYPKHIVALWAVFYAAVSIAGFWNGQIIGGLMLAFLVCALLLIALF